MISTSRFGFLGRPYVEESNHVYLKVVGCDASTASVLQNSRSIIVRNESRRTFRVHMRLPLIVVSLDEL